MKNDNPSGTILVLSNVTSGLVNFRIELLEKLCQQYHVVIIAEDNGYSTQLKEIGCEVVNFAIERHGTNPITDFNLIKQYIHFEKKYKPTVVLTYTIKPNVYGGIASRIAQTVYIANVTGMGDAIENRSFISLVAKKLYRIGLKGAKCVFFQNKSNKDFFIYDHLYKGKSILLPGSGVNLQKHCFEDYPIDTSKTVLSVIGRITKDKGIKEIIDAASEFKNEPVMIQLIGRCEGDYLEVINTAEKDGVIRYVGQQKNVHEWIKNSHAVLHASYHEGMSNVLLEAAACGRPLIATNIPGCREAFDDGVSGIAFEPRSVDSLVKAIRQFLCLPYEKKVDMGIKGREKVEREFDRNKVISAYLEEIDCIEKYQRKPC